MPFGRARLSLSRSFWRRDPLHERGRDAHDALTPEAPTRRCLSNAWADALRHGATCSAVFWIPGQVRARRGNARPYDFGVGRVVNVVKGRRLHGASLLVVLASLALSACELVELADENNEEFPRLIDEQHGLYGQVGFGSTEAQIRATFGEPGDGDGFFPLDADSYKGPPFIKAPDGKEPTVLRYEEVAFLVSSDGVFAITVTRPAASTRAGVSSGEAIQAVRESYERPSCGEAVAGEPLFGDSTPTYPWCRVRLARTNVFFGGDPIESVTLTLPN
jgi:hypothetical protein